MLSTFVNQCSSSSTSISTSTTADKIRPKETRENRFFRYSAATVVFSSLSAAVKISFRLQQWHHPWFSRVCTISRCSIFIEHFVTIFFGFFFQVKHIHLSYLNYDFVTLGKNSMNSFQDLNGHTHAHYWSKIRKL